MTISGYFDTIFASSGDLTTVPDAVQPDGSVSYTQGYGIDYSLAVGVVGRLTIERTKMNQLFYDITSALQQYQQHGTPPFITSTMNGGTPYSYSKYDRALYLGVAYRSLVDSNTTTPPSSSWTIDGSGFSTEINIASASTTDLASGGSQGVVAITGTTTITSFGSNADISAPIYFGRFTGALILTHNATSLILPAGANIQTVAGDTFVAQYLGSGNWKVLSYSPISGKAVAPIEEIGDWTPVLTFATAGNLSVAYTNQLGRYSKIGKRVTLNFKILTSSFTHTTASGQVRITGLPYSSANNSIDSISTLYFGGITKSDYTQFVMSLAGNDNIMKGVASGQGFSNLTVTATDMPTGSQIFLNGTLTYETP